MSKKDDFERRLDYDFKHWAIERYFNKSCEHCFCREITIYSGSIMGKPIPHKECCMCGTRKAEQNYRLKKLARVKNLGTLLKR